MTSIETLGINAVDMTHAAGDITVGGMQQQMIVIRHEAVGSYFEIQHFNCFLKTPDKNFAVPGRCNRLLASPATVHYMIPGPGIFYSQWA